MSREVAQIGDVVEITAEHPHEAIRGLRARVTTTLGSKPFVSFHPSTHKAPTMLDPGQYVIVARAKDLNAAQAFEAGKVEAQ